MIRNEEITVESRPVSLLRKIKRTGGSVIFVFLVTVSCGNPFSTREPELPSGLQTAWIQPVTPEIVFENLIAAFRERNVENYIRCFGLAEAVRQGFTFVPEISVANNYRGVFANWNIDEERNYINQLFNLLPADSSSSLLLTDVTEIPYGDSLRTTKEYDLLLGHKNPSVPNRLIGRMEISLRKGADALWFISYWADFKTGDFPVWSLLKAQF